METSALSAHVIQTGLFMDYTIGGMVIGCNRSAGYVTPEMQTNMGLRPAANH